MLKEDGVAEFRVLLIDDFEPFRQFLARLLENKSELRIVGEESDGMEAVKRATELQPDLIVLDIGLPTIHGIEAARRIRSSSPRSKIIFVSSESSVDIVEGVMTEGASGYVVKNDAQQDFLPAVDAVLRGGRFVGSRFSSHVLQETSG